MTGNRRLKSRLKACLRRQRGLGLAESLVAVAILGTAVTAFVMALSAGSIAVREQKEQGVIQSLAYSQLEYTKSYAYDPEAATYPAVAVPADYHLAVMVSPVPGADTDIQKITVTISREGQELLTVTDYKVNR